MTRNFKIDDEFKNLIEPLSTEEYTTLESNIQQNGCLSPLVVWDEGGDMLLVDGHTRLSICEKHEIEYTLTTLDVATRDEAKIWIIRNQLGRRNLTPLQRTELALKLEPLLTAQGKTNQGWRGKDVSTDLSKGAEPINTRAEVARIAGVSEGTVSKVKYIEENADDDTKKKLRSGDTTIHKVHSELKRKKESTERIEKAQAVQPLPELDEWFYGDWRKFLPSLKDKSITLLLTDPPFGNDYQSHRRAGQHEKIEADTTAKAAIELGEMLAGIYNKLVENAHLLIFTGWQHEPEFREIIQDEGYEIRGSLIWVKNNHGAGDLYGAFAPKHERIIHAVKGNPKLIQRVPDVFECAKVSTDRHPTEKPVELLMALINATTVMNEFVFDPFGGVASTLLAAKKTNRLYAGCELVSEFHAIGKERLNDGN